MQFSLLYFSGDGESTGSDRYRVLMETAKYADKCGFNGLWIPERHFQRFGGLYPNPAVLGAAIGMVTNKIQIRAGSVVIPLHNPVRIAEEWAVVDNLTNGRAAISVATGWHPGDYILAPQSYENRREITFKNLATIQSLWEGRTVMMPDIAGNNVEVRILPRPIQPKLPIWLTVSRNPDTWVRAGQMGANILCALISQKISDLKERIPLYRKTLEENGHDSKAGVVSLMLHTYVGESIDHARELVRNPMYQYLDSCADQGNRLAETKEKFVLAPGDREALLAHTFKRYFDHNSLLGDHDKCFRMLEMLSEIGVDEAACLVEFGLDLNTILSGMERLSKLRQMFNRRSQEAFMPPTAGIIVQ